MIIFAIIVMVVLAVRTFGFGMCAPGIIGMAACAASVLCMILAQHSSRRIIFNIIAALTCAGACVCIILAGKGNGGSGSISNREKCLHRFHSRMISTRQLNSMRDTSKIWRR